MDTEAVNKAQIINKNRITQSVILALATLISAITWMSLKDFLFIQGGWLIPLVGFFVMAVLLSLGWLLLRSKIILFTTLVIVLFGFFLAFGFNWVYLITAIVSLVLFFFGSSQSINEKDERVKIKIFKILELGLPSFLTGLILLIAVSFFFSPRTIIQIQVPRPLFDSLMKVIPMPALQSNLVSLAQAQLPADSELGAEEPSSEGFDIGKLESLLKDLKGGEDLNLEGVDLENIPIEDLSSMLSAGSEEEQRDNLYLLVNKVISDYTQSYKQYFAVGTALALFFILKTLSIPFMWLVIFASWLIFKLLVFVGAIKIHEKSVLQEVIEV